ncbi:MAG: DinB family protein [Chloroflexi bacterium]|nr:DinB family protein [Chloroflexota bacterium]
MKEGTGNRKADLYDFIAAQHAQSWPILAILTDEDREKIVYAPDDYHWTVQNVVSHLADAESGMLGQARRASQGKMTVPEDFDLERWNRSVARKSERNTIAGFCEQILKTHREILEFLDGLEDPSLDTSGRHSSGDILTIEGFLRRIASHRLEHAQDIQEALHK